MTDKTIDPGRDDQALREELLGQTGTVEWHEMEVHFARGMLIRVAPELDLIDVAMHMVRDRKELIDAWAKESKVVRVNDEDALRWHDQKPTMQALVVPPWVLVQEVARA